MALAGSVEGFLRDMGASGWRGHEGTAVPDIKECGARQGSGHRGH